MTGPAAGTGWAQLYQMADFTAEAVPAQNGHNGTGAHPAQEEEPAWGDLTPDQREQIRQQVQAEKAARAERYRLRTVSGTIDPEYLLIRDKRGRIDVWKTAEFMLPRSDQAETGSRGESGGAASGEGRRRGSRAESTQAGRRGDSTGRGEVGGGDVAV